MRNFRILLLVVLLSGVGCARADHVVVTGMNSLVPMAVQPAEPLPRLSKRISPKQPEKTDKKKEPEQKKKTDDPGRQEETKDTKNPGDTKGDAGAVAVVAATAPAKGFEPSSAAVLMVPASGDVRKRLVRSASRLVGITKSFDERSFLGHVLAINDLLPERAASVSWTSADHMKASRKAGKFKAGESSPVAGDIVFFKCNDACGADSADAIGAGILIDDKTGKESFVAYRKGTVEKVTAETSFIGYATP